MWLEFRNRNLNRNFNLDLGDSGLPLTHMNQGGKRYSSNGLEAAEEAGKETKASTVFLPGEFSDKINQIITN